MKAKIKPRIDLENRTKLETVIPLATPFIIFIDPCDRCNFSCKFCPTGDRELMKKIPGRNYGNMDIKLYRKIISDLAEFEAKIKVIRLYKDGEPLLNPHLPEMISLAKESGYCERVDTTTNASLLTPELSRKIITAGLDRINISIEGVNENQYKDFSNYKINFEQLVENIAYFYEHRKQCEMIVKINGDILTDQEKEKFYHIFGDISDGVFIESIMSCWPEFELNGVEVNQDVGIYGQEIKEVDVCPYIFYLFAINSNGTASTCFLDWSRKLLIGDVKDESVKDIWLGEEMQKYQLSFLQGERKSHPVCGECGQLSHGLPDNIDPYKKQLLSKIINR